MNLTVQWTALAREESRSAAEALEEVPSLVGVLAKSGAQAHTTRWLHNISTPIARASALLGPARVADLWPLCMAALPATIATLDAANPRHYDAVIDTILFVNLAETHGVETSAADVQHLSPKIGSDQQALRAAFSAIVLRQNALVSELTGEPMPRKVKPKQVFKIDTPGFLAYLAAASETKSGWDTVEPSWLSYLAHFPMKRAAAAAEWPQLYAAARASMGYCAQWETGSIALAVHKQIMQMIGAGL